MELAYIHCKQRAENIILQMSELDFLEWLSDGNESEVNAALERFEKIEAFEKCAIIRDYKKTMNWE